jgi:hypothetical protein
MEPGFPSEPYCSKKSYTDKNSSQDVAVKKKKQKLGILWPNSGQLVKRGT